MSNDTLILHRLHIQTGLVNPDYADLPASAALILDVETTGLNPQRDKIIELAMRCIHYTNEGIITQIGLPYCWREDPGFELDPSITKLTGLTNADLCGETIDDAKAIEIAIHSHAFHHDRPLPAVRKAPVRPCGRLHR